MDLIFSRHVEQMRSVVVPNEAEMTELLLLSEYYARPSKIRYQQVTKCYYRSGDCGDHVFSMNKNIMNCSKHIQKTFGRKPGICQVFWYFTGKTHSTLMNVDLDSVYPDTDMYYYFFFPCQTESRRINFIEIKNPRNVTSLKIYHGDLIIIKSSAFSKYHFEIPPCRDNVPVFYFVFSNFVEPRMALNFLK